LRIARIETFPLLYQLPKPYGDANGYKKYRTCFLFKIVTDTGIEGWGECIDWLPTLQKGFQERIIPYLIGKSAIERLPLVKTIKKWHQRAAAGVSMALTEITAKQANLSICDLWGGKWRDSIPVYASFQSYTEDERWIQHSAELVSKSVQSGFTQVKVKIGGKTIKEDQQHIEYLQNMLEQSVELALDANQSYDLALVRQWEKLFSQWSNIPWLEEPMPMNRTAEYKLLRSLISIPLAGGENMLDSKQFLPLLCESAIDILNPDTMHEDGIEGYRATLQLARSFGIRVSPHSFDGALSRYYAVLAQACIPPFNKMEENQIEPVEWDMMENPFSQLIPIAPVNGRLTIPVGTGLGTSINQDLLAQYLWDGRTYA